MFRSASLIVFVGCLAAIAINARSQEEPRVSAGKTNVQVLMRDKLTHMQKVLDGLVTDNFTMIGEEAEMLRIIGRAASWQAIDTKQYQSHSNRYGRLTSNLAKAAQDKNRDAALLQYLQLNISCVECHQYIRGQQQSPDPNLELLDP